MAFEGSDYTFSPWEGFALTGIEALTLSVVIGVIAYAVLRRGLEPHKAARWAILIAAVVTFLATLVLQAIAGWEY